MGIAGMLGIGSRTIIAEDRRVDGTVNSVKTCWWLKINTKPVRMGPLDGAAFPHIISFTYRVNGTEYRGSRYISYQARCPRVNEKITVFVSKADPSRYAVKIP